MSLSEEQEAKLAKIQSENSASRYSYLDQGKFVNDLTNRGLSEAQAKNILRVLLNGDAEDVNGAMEYLRAEEKADSNPRG